MDTIIRVTEQGEGNTETVFENRYLIGGISHTDSHQADAWGTIGRYCLKKLIEIGCIPLADGAVHGENMDEQDIGLDLVKGKALAGFQA